MSIAGEPHKILLLSYLFPPSGGVGVPRAISYTRYLPPLGCEVFVLAPRFPATPVQDPALMRLVPAETKVYRAFNPELPYRVRDRIWKSAGAPRNIDAGAKSSATAPPQPGLVKRGMQRLLEYPIRWLATPDPQVVWNPFAIRRACSIIERHGIGTVLCNAPPFSLTRIAVELKRRYPHLKLIAEFRDDWVGFHMELFDTSVDSRKRQLVVRMEREIMEAADFVSAVTPAQSDNMRRRYPDLPAARFLCAPNGYEPGAFEKFKPRQHGTGRMVVTYFGSLYTNPAYSPHLYLDAVDGLPEPLRSQLETRFIGRVAIEAKPLLENRQTKIVTYGFLPRDQGLPYLEETDFLLIIGVDETAHAGKLFDYLGTGKPILAITPHRGEIARMVRETKTGFVAEPNDPVAIRKLITDAWERLQNGTSRVEPDRAVVESYAWPNLIATFARKTGMAPQPGK